MGTKWRKFRYGTEDTRPAWSFYMSITGLGMTALSCGIADIRDDNVWWIMSYGFLIVTVVSLAHITLMAEDGRKEAVSVKAMDGKCPDLWLAVFLYVLFKRQNGLCMWSRYSNALYRAVDSISVSPLYFPMLMLILLATLAVSAFLVYLSMSLSRHLCREKWKKTLFFCRLYTFVKRKLRRLQDAWSFHQKSVAGQRGYVRIWRRRQARILAVHFAVTSSALLYFGAVAGEEALAWILFLAEALLFLVRFLMDMRTSWENGVLLEKIREMAEDVPGTPGPALPDRSLLHTAEEQLLTVQKIRAESLERQIQGERMKVELITNVSHDLKTPLTSMIGCIDLLAQTEGLPEEAKDYVKLLSVKAGRLREMIQDVFDMAKAAGGGRDLHIERLDMARLLRQTVADMKERMDASGLFFRIQLEDKELPFMGDGKKLYRVYQNLIENTLKYSMAGSRVYIKAEEKDGEIRTSVKNTSAYEMDFNEEEILERFTRGDKSRSTEGNGLGLAIAKTFTEACRGRFELTLDGDMFKVETVFLREDPSDK